jgi:hypothetical protein
MDIGNMRNTVDRSGDFSSLSSSDSSHQLVRRWSRRRQTDEKRNAFCFPDNLHRRKFDHTYMKRLNGKHQYQNNFRERLKSVQHPIFPEYAVSSPRISCIPFVVLHHPVRNLNTMS